MKKIIAVVSTLMLFASICPAKDKDVAGQPQPTSTTKSDTLTQPENPFGLVENKLDVGKFKSLKNKIPAIFDPTMGPSCGGCGGPHDCCTGGGFCLKQCK